ncbi:protein methyltransferase [Xylona heveae TC161]|uniref:Protein methyltransferase n=1 Tax=Xylona heveae (strain CBS 132557 / TC161) TaxID=1328760 RepID=A0A165J4Z3_XYLHT|nr:protein methyltransferase [Xylona heveae TC161]KZF25736.1 protein methyltransferase [Xylona heveae TC161]
MTSPATTAESASNDGQLSLKRFSNLTLKLDTPKGRGVFSTVDIARGTVIDISPVLILEPEDKALESKQLYNYTYNWPYSEGETGKTTMRQAVILGLGSMFNHSNFAQNVGFTRDPSKLVIVYTALRDIKAGEELCISYGSRLAFRDADEDKYLSDPEEGNDLLSKIELDD